MPNPKGDHSTETAAHASVQQAIKQERPFPTRSDEAMVGLMLTAEAVRRPFADLMARHGELTQQQYNVLRILRGAGPQGIPTLDIGERMIERTPGITRLIDRLAAKGMVERDRSESDRRQVICRISPAGRTLLKKLDRPVEALNQESMASLSKRELTELIRLLNKVRHQATSLEAST